jgi:hypothetical protein
MKKVRKTNKYRARIGAWFSDADAQKYGERLVKIEEKNGGMIRAIDVVEDAKNPRSPFHEAFEWDNEEAAHKWRLHKARTLINSIELMVRVDGSEKAYSAYLNMSLPVEDGKTIRRYVSLNVVMDNKAMRDDYLERAVSELKSWKEKYSGYKELFDVFDAIDSATASLFKNVKRKRNTTYISK